MYLLIRVNVVQVCDARDDDSSTKAGKIINVFSFGVVLRPDFIGVRFAIQGTMIVVQ